MHGPILIRHSMDFTPATALSTRGIRLDEATQKRDVLPRQPGAEQIHLPHERAAVRVALVRVRENGSEERVAVGDPRPLRRS